MDKFRVSVKRRVLVSVIQMVLLLAAIIIIAIQGEKLLSGLSSSSLNPPPDFITGFVVGMLSGILAVELFYLIKYIRALGNEEKFKALYISENDERCKYISSQIGSTALVIITIGLVCGVVISAFFNFTVCISLVGALLFVEIVALCLKAWYSKKY